MLGFGWKSGEAEIVKRRIVNQDAVKASGPYSAQTITTYEYIADVRPKDGSPPFRAVLQEPRIEITFKQPEVGQRVLVKYKAHGDGHKVKFDRADDGTYQPNAAVPNWRHHEDPAERAAKEAVRRAQSGEAQAEWEAELRAPPGDGAPPSGS
jgi:hypothetical protein